MAPARPSVSLIVPAHRDGPALRLCLLSLLAVDPAPDELIVVVDGGDEATLDAVREHGLDAVPVVPRGGPAHARNEAARRARGEVLLFIDSDVTVRPGIVEQVAATFAGGGVDAMIGSYDDAPPAPGWLSQYKNLLNHHVHQRAAEEGFTFWGACGAIRRDAFERLGGFDARRYPRPSVEDIELGYRLRAAGGRIVVRKDVQVTHLKRWTPATLLRSDVLDRALPWSELILERGFDDDLNIDRAGRGKVALAGATAAAGIAGLRWRPAGRAAVAGLVGLLAMDRELAAFLRRKRGTAFTAAALAWHWSSYLYGGAAFTIALARRGLRR